MSGVLIQLPQGWPWGIEFAQELLTAVHTLGIGTTDVGNTGPKKVEYDDLTAYWAGSVLRIDIPRRALV
jgi:hypothetical protein